MKKGSKIVRLGVLALTLTMVSTCLMGGTMARYVTEVTGTASASVAAWKFNVNDATSEKPTFTDIELGSTANRASYNAEDIADDVIAPGTKGSFEIIVDGTGSEVGVDYTVKIAAATGTTLPNDLTFKVDDTAYTLGSDVSGTIDYSTTDNAMKKTLKVTWEWAFGEGDDKDSNDNTYADANWTLDIAVTGKQVIPEAKTS